MARASPGGLTVREGDNVEPLVLLQPIAVNTGSPDKDGMLVMANGMLVAVLVRIETPGYEGVGGWFLEVALGPLEGLQVPTFGALDDATRWIRRSMKLGAAR